MDLTSKLRQLLPQKSSPAPSRRTADLDPYLHGAEAVTPLGPCYVVTRELPLDHYHGRSTLGEACQAAYSQLSRFGPENGDQLRLDETIFLDTETTGLAGGTGTYAFLVGLGYFTANAFVVKQILMRDYNEELALLHLVEKELRQKKTIVSFNGRVFDVPLLQTRFALALGFFRATGMAHFDLLPISRRL